MTAIRAVDLAAFDTPPEADLADALRTGAGSAAVRAALRAAKDMGERCVTVLGHPAHCPRFGFTRGCAHGIRLSIEVPYEAMMALTLDGAHPLPSGTVRYAAPFGI
ncbi:hypothetical protein ACIQU4_20015 [Streptomyces sp. NPDC090741]|uniref:hypothetical protein n=1 Tax=Streptomyces sp. NPDC090741 TaxID=3365967 RepID=UPI0037F48982